MTDKTDKTDTTALVIAEELNEWARDYAPTELATALAKCAAVLLKNQSARIAELEALQAAPPAPAAVAVPELRLTDEQIEQAFISARDEFMLREIGRTDKKLRLAFGRAVLKAALAAAPAQEHATQLAGQAPTSEELLALSRECQKMPGGMGMYYYNYARAVLDRWGAAPAQAQEDARALEAPAAPEWERVRRGLSMMMMGFASTPGKPLQAAEAALDAATEPGMPLACLRALAAAPQAPAAPADPMDWPLPCDVTVGHGTIGKGCKLRALVLRMQVLYNLAQQNAPAAPAAPALDALTQAARDVLAERARQVERKGYNPEHDDSHVLGEIGALAALYLMPDGARSWDASSTGYGDTLSEALLPSGWSLPAMGGDCRADAVKGVACGLAEIERLDRAAARAAQGGAA